MRKISKKGVSVVNKPEVQIIIPVYNAEKYLRTCLDSVRAQTFEGWQALLIDDASSDRSMEIIEEYCSIDKRFKCIQQNTNKGASSARNRAISQLSAEYTAFLDSDDYWEDTMLECLMKKAKENGSDVVQCRFLYDYKGGKQVLPKGAFSQDISLSGSSLKKVYIKMMTGINMNHVCMKLIRTSLIKDMQFDTSLKTAEDLKFCVELFKKVKKYDFINKALYHYYRNETSLTGKGLSYKEKFKANARVSQELVKALPDWDMNTPFYTILSLMRPYVITISKIWRMICEKIFTKG